MLTVSVHLLAGRYTATSFNDRTQGEWPPHPARLYSAMVAAWADADTPDAGERRALEWLEAQEPPSIACSLGRRVRRVVTHYVPVNDPTTLTRDLSPSYRRVSDAMAALRVAKEEADAKVVTRAEKALERARRRATDDAAAAATASGRESESIIKAAMGVLPDRRGRQGRTYPSVVPDDERVCYLWTTAVTDAETITTLDRLLARVGRIGHSSTPVSCRIDEAAVEVALIPGGSSGREGVTIRVPRRGSLAALEQAYEASQHGQEPRVLPAGTAVYRRPDARQEEPAQPLLGGDWYVLELGPSQRMPALFRVLDVARAVRGALLRHGDQPPPELLSGHLPSLDGTPTAPTTHAHVAYAPLANVGHGHGDGAILGVAIVVPRGATAEERGPLERALQAWSSANDLTLQLGPPERALSLRFAEARLDARDGTEVDAERGERWGGATLVSGRARRVLTRRYWCRPARLWRSVTPIVLDRFPGDLGTADPGRRRRAEQEAVETISRACTFAGLPRPKAVTLRLDGPWVGVPAARGHARRAGGVSNAFPPFRTGTQGLNRLCIHAEITFGEAVGGPVLIGTGRYLGYGLCLPASSEEMPG